MDTSRILDLLDLRAGCESREHNVSLSEGYRLALQKDPSVYQDYLDARESETMTTGARRKFLAKMVSREAAKGRGATPYAGALAPLPART